MTQFVQRERLPCDACRRPARRRQLWARHRGAEAAVLVGVFGPACFYRVAHKVAESGHQPERWDASVIWLRGRA